jgi:hypothetical protein
LGDLTGKMDQFVQDWSPQQGPTCSVGMLMAALPKEEADALRRLFASRVYATDISKFIQSEVPGEHPEKPAIGALARAVKPDATQRHRRGACGCEDKG